MPRPAPAELKDFGDWLSPIIVKELRQGMRTKLFTTAFIVIQGMMLLLMLIGLSDQPRESSLEGWFWALVSIVLLLIMPLRGFGALSSEVRLNTMDLISMTRMSAWRITLGKWAALVGQSILLTVAVLPYVVIRYFYGGVNVLAELVFLMTVLVASCLLSAAIVGLSAFPNFLIRSLFTVGGMIAVTNLFSFYFMAARNTASDSGIPFSDQPGAVWFYVGFIGMAIFLMYLFLDVGATRIAPEAVNYSTRKRALGLLVLVLFFALPGIFPKSFDATVMYILAAFFVTFLAVDSLTEKPSGVRSLHLPFVKMGIGGRILQYIFTPGWFTGVFYVLTLGLIFFLGERLIDGLEKDPMDEMTFHLSFVSSLLFPLVVIHLFFPEDTELFPAYFFVQCAAIIVGFSLLLGSEGLEYPSIMWAGCPLPFVSFLMAAEGEHVSGTPLFVLSLVTFVISVGVCVWRGQAQVEAMQEITVKPSKDRSNPEMDSAKA